MEKISKELEQRIIELLKLNKTIDAINLVQKELQLGLRLSKEMIDDYKKNKVK